jgi:hypothetical protein
MFGVSDKPDTSASFTNRNKYWAHSLNTRFLALGTHSVPRNPLHQHTFQQNPTNQPVKGKGHPRTGNEGPEEEKRHSSTLSLTSALDGMGGQRHASVPLPPGKTRYPLWRKLGGPRGRSGRMREISPPPRIDPRTVHSVASRYTDWAIPAHTNHPAVLVFKQPVITYQISRCCILKTLPLWKPQIWLAVPFAILLLVICFRKRSSIMKVITNVYCLRNAPLKTTCCLGKGTGKAATEQLTKSQLENCKCFTPRKLQTFESHVYKGLHTVIVPTAYHLPLTADHALTRNSVATLPQHHRCRSGTASAISKASACHILHARCSALITSIYLK